jgi:HEAT repeat protein
VPRLVRQIEHGATAEEREEAAQLLATEAGREQEAPVLRRLLRHPDAAVRKWGAYGLGFYGRSTDARLLVAGLDDPDADVRCHVLEAIGHLLTYARNRRRVLPRVLAMLQDSNPEIRFWACFAVSQVGDEREIRALEQLTADRALIPGWWSVGREARWAIDWIRARARGGDAVDPQLGEI